MAKNVIPGMQTGGGVMSKLVGTVVMVAILVLVIKHPGDAANFVKAVFGGLVTFIDSLVG